MEKDAGFFHKKILNKKLSEIVYLKISQIFCIIKRISSISQIRFTQRVYLHLSIVSMTT